MDTALPQKFPFNLDRNLAKANCTGNRVCTSCVTVVLGHRPTRQLFFFRRSTVTTKRAGQAAMPSLAASSLSSAIKDMRWS